VASRLADQRALLGQMAQQASPLNARVAYRWLLGLARVLERTTRWVLQNVELEHSSTDIVDQNLSGLAELRDCFGEVVRGEERKLFEARVREIQELGADEAFSRRLITLRFLDQLLEILEIARETGFRPVMTAYAYYQTSEAFEVPWLRRRTFAAAGDDQWEQRAAQVISDDLSRAHRKVAVGLMRRAAEGGADAAEEPASAEASPDFLAALKKREVERFREIVAELQQEDAIGLPAMSVVTRELADVSERLWRPPEPEERR
jgi:glutamate dehydrogenase